MVMRLYKAILSVLLRLILLVGLLLTALILGKWLLQLLGVQT